MKKHHWCYLRHLRMKKTILFFNMECQIAELLNNQISIHNTPCVLKHCLEQSSAAGDQAVETHPPTEICHRAVLPEAYLHERDCKGKDWEMSAFSAIGDTKWCVLNDCFILQATFLCCCFVSIFLIFIVFCPLPFSPLAPFSPSDHPLLSSFCVVLSTLPQPLIYLCSLFVLELYGDSSYTELFNFWRTFGGELCGRDRTLFVSLCFTSLMK